MSDVPALPRFPTWAEAESFLQAILGDQVAERWIDKPQKRFRGASLREAFDTDREAAVELLHQIANGFVL